MKAAGPLARAWLPAGASLALLIGAMLLVWRWLAGDQRAAALAERGVDTTATVVSVTMSAGGPTKSGGVRPAQYFVTCSFVDSIGTPHQAMTGGASGAYASLAEGQQIAVRYLPDDPEVSVYGTGARSDPGLRPIVLVVLLSLAALLGTCLHRLPPPPGAARIGLAADPPDVRSTISAVRSSWRKSARRLHSPI